MFRKLFLSDRFILILILINAVTIFSEGFVMIDSVSKILHFLDHTITFLFIIELIVKISAFGTKGYLESNWNKFDFILILLAIPSLLSYLFAFELDGFSYLLALRVLRIFRSLRFFRFIPGFSQLLSGITRAVKASTFVFLGFGIYLFLIGIVSFQLFKGSAPEYFSNPARSLFSTFTIFTVEGWTEVPEIVTAGMSPLYTVLTYLYFVFVVLTGGIFGMSLVNSIFVDAMVSDNTEDLEEQVRELDRKISLLLSREGGKQE